MKAENEKVPHLEMGGAEDWEAFRKSGLLWFVNRMLHVFNWSIVVSYDSDTGEFLGAWPARTTWKGFPQASEKAGYQKLDDFLKQEFGEK